jgi:hypothetical protein
MAGRTLDLGSRPGESAAFALPAGELFALPPGTGREQHQLWEITTTTGQTWRQALAERIALDIAVEYDTQLLTVTNSRGETLGLTLVPRGGRERKSVVLGYSSHCCMAASGRTGKVELRDFEEFLVPAPTRPKPTLEGLTNALCGNRPNCPAAVWIA